VHLESISERGGENKHKKLRTHQHFEDITMQQMGQVGGIKAHDGTCLGVVLYATISHD